MDDADGPLIAKAVYHGLFNQSISRPPTYVFEKLWKEHIGAQQGDYDPRADPDIKQKCERFKKVLLDSVTEGSGRTLALFPLAQVIDDTVRYLRLVENAPAERWATFVHIGV